LLIDSPQENKKQPKTVRSQHPGKYLARSLYNLS